MNPVLKHYLDDGWQIVRTTFRWHYIRNLKKSSHLRGNGVQTSRIVRTWYEPIYFWARTRWHKGKLHVQIAKRLLDEQW